MSLPMLTQTLRLYLLAWRSCNRLSNNAIERAWSDSEHALLLLVYTKIFQYHTPLVCACDFVASVVYQIEGGAI